MSPETVTSMAQKRVRRQKQFIAVGSIVLLAVLGFELPKLLGGGGSNAVTAVTTVSPGAVGVPPAVALGRLPATDRVVIERDSNQLISFGLFKSKDPFVQQLSTTPSAPAAAPTPTPTTATAAPASPSTGLSPAPAIPATTPGASAPTGAPGAPVAQGTTPGTTTPAAPAAAPTQALLSTNGVCEQVAVNGTFPANENIFRLVSIAQERQVGQDRRRRRLLRQRPVDGDAEARREAHAREHGRRHALRDRARSRNARRRGRPGARRPRRPRPRRSRQRPRRRRHPRRPRRRSSPTSWTPRFPRASPR